VRNLAGSAEHRLILEKFRTAMRVQAEATRDVCFLPEGEIHSRSQGSSPYDMAHDEKKYPFARIFDAADLASRLRPTAVPQLQKLITDSDSAVRYWAALGLLMRGQDGFDAGADALRKALDDDSPYVRIAAAEALGRFGSAEDLDKALALLLPASDPSSSPNFVCMAAMNALDYLDESAAPAVDKIKLFAGKHPDALPRTEGYIGNLRNKILADFGVEAADPAAGRGKKRKDR
jgi:uncharacterized sulfatase